MAGHCEGMNGHRVKGWDYEVDEKGVQSVLLGVSWRNAHT